MMIPSNNNNNNNHLERERKDILAFTRDSMLWDCLTYRNTRRVMFNLYKESKNNPLPDRNYNKMTMGLFMKQRKLKKTITDKAMTIIYLRYLLLQEEQEQEERKREKKEDIRRNPMHRLEDLEATTTINDDDDRAKNMSTL